MECKTTGCNNKLMNRHSFPDWQLHLKVEPQVSLYDALLLGCPKNTK